MLLRGVWRRRLELDAGTDRPGHAHLRRRQPSPPISADGRTGLLGHLPIVMALQVAATCSARVVIEFPLLLLVGWA